MKKEHVFKCNGIVAHSCLDIKDEFLFVATWKGDLLIFNLESKKEVGKLSIIKHWYHNMILSNSNNMAILSCYKYQIYFVDIENRSKPTLLYSYNPEIGCVLDFSFSPNDEYVIMGGYSNDLILYDLNKKKITKKISGHSENIPYVFYTENG